MGEIPDYHKIVYTQNEREYPYIRMDKDDRYFMRPITMINQSKL